MEPYLVKVCAQEVNFSLILEQPRPILFLEIFLSQDHLDVGGSVVCLGVLYVDLGVELEVEMIGGLLAV